MFSLDELNKKIKSNNKLYWFLREWYVIFYSMMARLLDRPATNVKKRILFYHINGLGFAGTEKFLQILAKYLNKEKYDVFYLYSNQSSKNPETIERLEYLKNGGVLALPFNYRNVRSRPPYFVEGMNPDIKKLIKTLHIDLFVTAGAGSANYPFSIIKNIPIILLNIFGQPNVQKNISFHLCISKEVASKLRPIVREEKIQVYPVPSEGPSPTSKERGKNLRRQFNINDNDMAFGRIGRADDGIFDPIGIKAFKKVVSKNPNAHYLIMSPPPILERMVNEEKIPNVHFLSPTGKEEDVWAFHQAIDTLAHFRYDGESFGLNIVESMLCGKPIITHRSRIWNAHLEYLEPAFSRVADRDNVKQYESFMEEFIELKRSGRLEALGEAAAKKSKMFLIENNIGQFEKWIDKSIVK